MSHLKTFPELDQKEILVKHAALYAASKYIGEHCHNQNVAFLKCKAESEDPEHCLKAGQAVTVCAVNVLEKLNSQCKDAFNDFAHCLDTKTVDFSRCKKKEAALYECARSKVWSTPKNQ